MARLRGNSWQADYTVNNKRNRVDGFASKEEAELWEAKARLAARLGQPIPPVTSEARGRSSGITLGKLVESTINNVWGDKPGARVSAINARIAVEFFGANRPAAEIKRPDLVGYAMHLRSTTANSTATINRKLAALSRALSHGVEIGALDAAPCLKGIRKAEGEGRLRYLEEDSNEEERILQTFRLWGMHEAADFTIFLIDTGARWVSEGLSLEDHRVNWRTGQIVFAGHLTKSKKTRAVPMSSRVRGILEARRKAGLLWTITEPQYRHAWDRMKQHLGLGEDGEFVPHCLRHTCASRLVQSGVDLYTVQRWLGHADIKQTMRYSHLAPKHLLPAKSALDLYNERRAAEAPALVVVK